MRPYVICHMVASIDGKIEAGALKDVTGRGEYERTGSQLGGSAWICGRVTMEQHFAARERFVSATNQPSGPQPVFVASLAKSYAISVDPQSKLRWENNQIDGEHLICVVAESAPSDYLAMLREKGISYIVAGETSVDLAETLNLLGMHFQVQTLLLEGGGHINGGFLQAGLVDEISLLLVPGVDGRHDVPGVFDGMSLIKDRAVSLKLKSFDRRENGALWLRYQVVRS